MIRFFLGIVLGIAIGIGLGKQQELTPEQRKKMVYILVASFIMGLIVALFTSGLVLKYNISL